MRTGDKNYKMSGQTVTPGTEILHSTQQLESSGYDRFAWFYDQHWGRDIASDFLSAFQKLLAPQLKKGDAVLDLCCGTGRLTAELGGSGFEVTGLDSSAEMLGFAKQNAPDALFVQGDARSFLSEPQFKGVVCTFDSLNHMMSLMDLTSVFDSVHRAMLSEGFFLFDMNLEHGFRLHWQDEYSFVSEDAVCLVKGFYDRAAKLGTYEFTLFRRILDNWERSDFAICQRPYRRHQIERGLKCAGFINIKVFDAQRDLGLTEHGGRIFVLAEKRGAL